MKKFEYWDYYESCPLAVEVERAINTCGSLKDHLAKLNEIFSQRFVNGENVMSAFFSACICYWGKIDYYDGRNMYAVFTSREIVKKFPEMYEACECLKDDLLLEAFGFTMSAHRYLQNELFKTILEYYKDHKSEDRDIDGYLNEMEFVFNDDETGLIPYKEYRMAKYGY